MRTPPLLAVFLTVVIDLLGFGIVLPLLPLWAERFGASPIVIGLLLASYAVMQFLLAPVWGRVSDRVGRRPVILVALAGSALAALALVAGSSVILTDPIFQGMAISLLFGVLVSTLLTLVVIPLGCVSAGRHLVRH